jgi:hypothetical protein
MPAYTRQYTQDVGWENEPSTATPINAANLNKMDDAIGAIDAELATLFGNGIVAKNSYATVAQAGLVKPDGRTITVDSDGEIHAVGGSGGASALDDLTDTDITDPATGEVLTYNGTSGKWENEELPEVPIATTSVAGKVKPDGATITVDDDGTIHGTSGIPVGSTVTPICDIQTWLHCAGIGSKNYTTLVQILSDEVTLATLMSNSNAADYLVRSTDWANTICADSTAMAYIGENDYCAVTLLADNTWRSAICNSAYFESVLNVKVPTMTSNTAPIGECSGSGYTPSASGGGNYFNAFDGKHNTWWNSDVVPTASNPEYIEYVFPHAVAVNKVAWSPYSSSVYPIQMKLKASNDGNTWTEIADITGTSDDSQSANIVGQTAYTHWAIFVYEHQSSDRGMFRDLQFYGRSLADAEPDGGSYSTQETLTGETWIDGRPIFRKVIDFGYLPNATEKAVSTGLSNVQFIKLEGLARASNGYYQTFPGVSLSTFSNNVGVYINTSNQIEQLVVATGSDRSGYYAYFILEYVKNA